MSAGPAVDIPQRSERFHRATGPVDCREEGRAAAEALKKIKGEKQND